MPRARIGSRFGVPDPVVRHPSVTWMSFFRRVPAYPDVCILRGSSLSSTVFFVIQFFANIHARHQYETALSKHNQGRDPNILSCLGRVWYAKGKKESKMEKEKAFESMKNSLEYAKKVSLFR
jgi:hypothetical protein